MVLELLTQAPDSSQRFGLDLAKNTGEQLPGRDGEDYLVREGGLQCGHPSEMLVSGDLPSVRASEKVRNLILR